MTESTIRYPVLQGTACRCPLCQAEREGRQPLYRSDEFCAQCGHGYFEMRTGRPDDAQKCGAIGQFVATKPDLPAAVDRLAQLLEGA